MHDFWYSYAKINIVIKLNKHTFSFFLQMGTSSRSDKVRTYNFPQDRITDHRILKTLHNVILFLEGGQILDTLISDLILESDKARYMQFILSLKEK